MILGLAIVVLLALYYVLGLLQVIYWPGSDLVGWLYSGWFLELSGQSLWFPGMSLGVLLSVLGLLMFYWDRTAVLGRSVRWIQGVLLVGGLIVIIGAIVGAFPFEFAHAFTGQDGALARGYYSTGYMGLVFSGFSIILAGVIWASWKLRLRH